MKSIKQVLSLIPWWGWIAGIVIILIIWQSFSGWAMSRKLYNMALDNLREDQSNVIKTLEENQKMYEVEIGRLNQQVESIQKEKIRIRAKADQSAAEVVILRGKINELQTQINNIVVSDNPDVILDDLRKLGFGSIHRH